VKNLIAGILIGLSVMAGTAYAGLWEKVTTMGLPTKQPTTTYSVEAAGWNLRVYEWTPEHNPGVSCMFAAGSEKGGVACYPK
jgi:hypothetical protein